MRLDTTVALIPKEYHVTAPSPPPSPNINTIPPSPPPSPNINTIPMLDVDLLKACCTCGLVVWIGPAHEIPDQYTRACPKDTDWSDVNADPYCHGCWAKESEFLRGLTNQHKAIGGRKQENQGQQKTQEKTVKKTKKKAVKKKKKANANKKKMGGHHGPLLASPKESTEPVLKVAPKWKIGQAVNAKYTDNKYYGAFIVDHDEDGTYVVYYPEDSETLSKVPCRNIKKPIMSGKTSIAITDYKGKRFFDAGTGKPGDDNYFPPGTFIVKKLASNNNFYCLNVDDDDIEENFVEFDWGYTINRIRLFDEE